MGSGLSDSVSTGLGPLASYALAAVVVLVLVVVVLVVAKRVMGSGPIGTGSKRGPRLAVLDVAAVDQRRKLVLIRRDDVEHLVLIGGQNDIVVEKGIVRTPQSLRQQAGEWSEGRAAVSGTAPPAPVRAPAIAPQPRPPAGASPLRRPVPPRPNFEPIVPPAVPEPEQLEPQSIAPIVPPMPERPAPKVEAPRAMAPAVIAPVEVPRPERPLAPRREEERSQVADVEAPVEEKAAVQAEPVFAPPSPPAPRPSDESSEPRIPAFLRRGGPSPAPLPEPEPEPVAPPAPEPARMAPPLPFPFPTLPVSEPKPEPAERVEPRAPVFSPPVFPTLRTAPVAEPVVSVEREPEPEEAPEVAATVPPTLPPAAPSMEDPERRPLAVRSFATTIQSRRTNFEPSRGGAPGEKPAPQAPPVAPAPSIPSFLQIPPKPVPAPVPTPAPAPAPQDLSLEDDLSQKLNSDFGSVEWPDDKPAAPERANPPEADQPPVAQTVHAKPAERELTLEEEMERLLSDFDFGDRRR